MGPPPTTTPIGQRFELTATLIILCWLSTALGEPHPVVAKIEKLTPSKAINPIKFIVLINPSLSIIIGINFLFLSLAYGLMGHGFLPAGLIGQVLFLPVGPIGQGL